MRRLAVALLLTLGACTTYATVEGTTSASSAAPQSGWVEMAPMQIARSEHPAVVLDDEIVVLGGLIETGVGRTGVTPTVEAYDPEADSWRQLPPLPEPRHHGMAAVVDDRLFFMGGYSTADEPTATTWELVDDTWETRAPSTAAVAAAATVALGDQLLVIGGVPDGYLQAYDIATDQWAILPAPTTQREHVAAAVVDGEVWAVAGRWMGEIFDTTEIYDPNAESWRDGPSLNDPRSGFGAAVVGKAIIVAGGEVFGPDQALSSAERLNAEPEGWFPIDALPHGLHGNPLVSIGKNVFLPGGSTRPAGVDNDGVTYVLDAG